MTEHDSTFIDLSIDAKLR